MKKFFTFLTITCTAMIASAEQITVNQALQIAGQLAQGATTTDEYEVVGYVTAFQGSDDGGWAKYGNQIFWIADASGSGAQSNADGALEVYQGVPTEMVYIGDKVSVKATLTNYNGLLETTKRGIVTILEKVERPAFSGKCKIGDLYYNVNAENKTAEVTYERSNSSSNYSGLTTIDIPASVEYNALTYNVTSIGDNAFDGCRSLTSIIIPNSVTSIGISAFYNCYNLPSITLPNSVTSIGRYAFNNCSSLSTITIPDNVTGIEEQTFYYCTGLTSVTIGNRVTSIGSEAFSYCTNLTAVTIPNSVTSIGSHAFSHCGLISVDIPNSVTNIGDCAFMYCSNMSTVTIPNSITSIGHYTFENCSNLTSINIPNSVTSIGESAFSGCSNLTSIEIPNSVTYIGQKAFYYCSKLTSVNIPNGITEIREQTFYHCTNLTSVIIPANVTNIGKEAFLNCTGLTSITCEAINPPALGINVFHFVDTSIPLYVPQESIEAYKTATSYWSYFTNILAITQTDIEETSNNQQFNAKDKKIFRNGKILIERNGNTYSIEGVQVR